MKKDVFVMPEGFEPFVIPPELHQRLLDTCAALPDKSPTKSRRPLKIAFSSAAGLAAAFMLMCGVNMANPVFAEGLPLVGGLFKQYNGQNKTAVGSYVGTYGGVEEVKDVTAVSGGLALSLTETYSDGTFIHCAFRLDTPSELDGKFDYIGLPMEVTVDGKSVPGGPYYDDPEAAQSLNLKPQAQGYGGTLAIRLPQAAKDGDKLALSYQCEQAVGYTVMEEYAEEPLPEGSFSGSCTVTADTSNNRTTGDFTGTGPVQVLSVTQTPSETQVEFEIPYWGQIGRAAFWRPLLFLPDGTEIRYNGSAGDVYEKVSPDAETLRRTASFDGLPKDTQTVILRFGHEYLLSASAQEREHYTGSDNRSKVMAELTVDLKSQSYTPTTSYLAAGMVSDAESVFTDYLTLDWFLPYNDPFIAENYPGQRTWDEFFAIDEIFQQGFALERMALTKEGNAEIQLFKRGDDYRDIRLTLEKDGQTVATADSAKTDWFDNAALAGVYGDTEKLYENVEEGDEELRAAYDADLKRKTPGQNYYGMRFALTEGAQVNFMDSLTLKLSDRETGELLYEKDIRMSNKEIFDF